MDKKELLIAFEAWKNENGWIKNPYTLNWNFTGGVKRSLTDEKLIGKFLAENDSYKLFHECPECNCRCNCDSHPCNCCSLHQE